jgi:hypothetical protein
MSAAAEADRGAASEIKGVALGVIDGEIVAFNAHRAIIANGYFGHGTLLGARASCPLPDSRILFS